jgi:hypothetical protein
MFWPRAKTCDGDNGVQILLFLPNMKNGILQNTQSIFNHSLVAVAIAILGVACQPKSETVDETQTQLREANVSLARLSTIEEELRPYGVNVRTPTYSTYYITRKPTAELQILETKLTEYVAQGSNALRISARLDVSYSDRAGLAERIGNARMLLHEVKKTLGVATDSSDRFSANWHECNSVHQQNLVIYGVRILYFNPAIDSVRLMRLPRERRREIAARARRYQECEFILAQGRAQIFEGSSYKPGISKSYDVTGKPSRIGQPQSSSRVCDSDGPM